MRGWHKCDLSDTGHEPTPTVYAAPRNTTEKLHTVAARET